MRPVKVGLAVALVVAVAVVLVWVGLRVWVSLPNLLAFDEWYCSEGEVPVNTATGATFCAPEGYELVNGETFDPLGNRPFDCDNRRGWVVVDNRTEAEPQADCWPADKPLSDEARSQGWVVRE